MEADLLGGLLAISAAIFFAIRVILVRKATVTGRPVDAVTVALWIGLLVFLPLSVILYWPDFGLTRTSIITFIGTGLSGNFFGLICYYEGTKRVGASRTVSISTGRLLVATFLSIIFLKEPFTIPHLLGIFILTFGITVVSREMKGDSSGVTGGSNLDFLLPFGAMVFFGLTGFLIKVGLSEGTPVYVGLSIHFSSALLVLTILSAWRGNFPLRILKTEERFLYIAAGITYVLALIFVWSGLNLTDVIIAYPLRSLSLTHIFC
ncbi:hypothetical protein AKJ62_04540 [candidate division MSBL1 archaeon SCGC-AAA259D14]|uniref:EamA domain-containing protein n=1 Tax=candidate division MSBL1 archaeon SCGC-AAA259D14 TaxID=1698261 RepID=A0A133U3K1_9EURY|nr:hypothetical protein AKJ62_04540 [candidate division MSBL1 archaeon SCGC-AAA259D14]